jgi:hypothetical protein
MFIVIYCPLLSINYGKLLFWRWERLDLQQTSGIIGNLSVDLRFGGKFLGGMIQTKYDQLVTINRGSSDFGALPYIFKDIIKPEDVLVDVGCGNGRVINWWLHSGYKNTMIGLELDEEIASKVSKRLNRHTNVTIIPGDAINNLPKQGTVFYLHNPFGKITMERFKERMFTQFSRNGDLKILYYNNKHVQLFHDDSRWVVQDIHLGKGYYPMSIIKINIKK